MTRGGKYPMTLEEENCTQIIITEDDVSNSVKIVPKLETLVSKDVEFHAAIYFNTSRMLFLLNN